MPFRLTLTRCIGIGLVFGGIVGLAAPESVAPLSRLPTLFVRLLQMLVAPLVFSTLVVGIAGQTGPGSLRRLAVGSLAFFAIATTLAACGGLAAGLWAAPGAGVVAPLGGAPLSAISPAAGAGRPFLDTLIPTSVAEVWVTNNLLGLVFISILFALALRASAAEGGPLLRGCSALAAVMFRLTAALMWLAPIAVFGATASLVGRAGPEGLRPFAVLLATAYVALGLFAATLAIVVSRIARFALIPFLRSLSDVLLLAFFTASSAAALPGALDRLQAWGASHRVASFVLPLGYSFNLTGTAVYLPLVTVFWAQMNGVSLSWTASLALLGYVLVVIRGIPTVPRGLFLIWGGVLAQVHLPADGVVVLLGIDPLIDMARTTVNVWGNCLAVAALRQCEDDMGSVDAAPESPAVL